jgi:hypothetical protein
MPTQPAILQELAARYGGCDPASEGDVTRFYKKRFRRLPRAQRDLVSFEILHWDGEAAPAAPLTRDEICSLDRLVETEEAAAAPAESASAMTTCKRVALRQAEVSIGVFGGLAAVNFLPLAF